MEIFPLSSFNMIANLYSESSREDHNVATLRNKCFEMVGVLVSGALFIHHNSCYNHF